MNFQSFALHPDILAGVRAAGYETPTPIQEQAIPHALEGRDVMGLAQTGTGKTAAFVLPLLQRLIQTQTEGRGGPGRGPVRGLILAPTRELAGQILDSIRQLGKPCGCRATAIFGGVSQHPQVDALRRGVSIVVACPGRLLDLMQQGLVDLSKVETLVLDEADHMFDMGFLPAINRILAAVPSKRQTMLFSATMPPAIQGLADATLTNPVRVALANTRPVEKITQTIYPVASHRKAELLATLLKSLDAPAAIVFTRTKHRAKSLARRLELGGFKATSLQGNLSQRQREQAMGGFKNGVYRVLVATDIAARGIDCSAVSHVINFDLPDTVENYTHRIGRTGRADREGHALTLACPEDHGMIRSIERTLGRRLDRCVVDAFDDLPAEPLVVEQSRQPRQQRRPQGPAAHAGQQQAPGQGQPRGQSRQGQRAPALAPKAAGPKPGPRGDGAQRGVRFESGNHAPAGLLSRETQQDFGLGMGREQGVGPMGDRPAGNRPSGSRSSGRRRHGPRRADPAAC